MNVGKHTFSSHKSHVARTFWAQETSLSEEMLGCGNSQEASHAELRTLMTPGIHYFGAKKKETSTPESKATNLQISTVWTIIS